MSLFGRAAGVQSATAPQGADFVLLAQLRFHAQNCPSLTFLHFFADSGSGAALVPASPDPLAAEELVDNTNGGAGEFGHTIGLADGTRQLRHTTGLAGGTRQLRHATALNLLPVAEGGTELAAEETTLLVHSHVLPTPTTTPNTDAKQTFPVKKKPPAPKQVNTARKHPKPKPTLPRLPQAPSLATLLDSGPPSASQAPHVPAEAVARVGHTEQSTPELSWGGQATTSRPTLQISPSTLPPGVPGPFAAGTGDAGEAPTTALASATVNRTNGTESEVHGPVSEESQETTTSTIITTTVTTTEPSPGKLHCLHRVGSLGQGIQWVTGTSSVHWVWGAAQNLLHVGGVGCWSRDQGAGI